MKRRSFAATLIDTLSSPALNWDVFTSMLNRRLIHSYGQCQKGSRTCVRSSPTKRAFGQVSGVERRRASGGSTRSSTVPFDLDRASRGGVAFKVFRHPAVDSAAGAAGRSSLARDRAVAVRVDLSMPVRLMNTIPCCAARSARANATGSDSACRSPAFWARETQSATSPVVVS